MSAIDNIKRSQSFQEFSNNKRLQWMIVIIGFILTLSVSKTLIDATDETRLENKQQVNLLAKLQSTSNEPIDENTVRSIDNLLKDALTNIPTAPSSSVAEATALAQIEQKIGKLIKRKRMNLVGSDTILGGEFWSVRIDINGQLAESKYIEFLQHFDANNKHIRIMSLRYSPKTSNSINLVVDMLFMKVNNE